MIKNGIKVKYNYKGEIRTGYVKFMGNSRNGKAKFEFVGTNNKGKLQPIILRVEKRFGRQLTEKIFQ